MTSLNFDTLRTRKPDCPSPLALESYAVEELPADQAEAIRQHLPGCEACQKRLAANSFAAQPAFDERLMLAGLRRKLDEKQASQARARRWLRGLGLGGFSLAAAVGVVAMIFAAPRLFRTELTDPSQPESVRIKGAPVLHVYLRRGDQQEEVLSGARFRPGDGIRFVVDLPAAGAVTVVGVESSGSLYVAWPRASSQDPTRLPAGKAQMLPGGMTLDESTGRETLYLVHCPQSTTTPVCESRGNREPPRCPPGCTLSAYLLDKSP